MRDPLRYWQARATALADVLAEHRRHLIALAGLLPIEHLWTLDTDAETLETLIRQIDVEHELRTSARLSDGDVESELGAVWNRLATGPEPTAPPPDPDLVARYS